MNKSLIDTYDSLKNITFNTSLMVQSDVNSLLYQLDKEISLCIKKLYYLIPNYVRNYYLGIMVAWLRRKLKRYSMHNDKDINPSCINFILNCNTKSPDVFLSLVLDCRLLRGIHYTFIGKVLTDYDRSVDFNSIMHFRRTYGSQPCGEFKDVNYHFELVRKIQEKIEKPFYKKVIANSIAISNRNLNFVEDNFMCGTYGLRKAIWRFDIYNGGILASFIDNWINNSIAEFQAPNIVRVPKDAGYIYGKLLAEMNKRKLHCVEDAAKYFGMSPNKARDLESTVTREANVRIDIATQGVEDYEGEERKELTYTFTGTEEEDNCNLDYLLNGVSTLDKNILFASFGLFDKIENSNLTKEEIQDEILKQKSVK